MRELQVWDRRLKATSSRMDYTHSRGQHNSSYPLAIGSDRGARNFDERNMGCVQTFAKNIRYVLKSYNQLFDQYRKAVYAVREWS